MSWRDDIDPMDFDPDTGRPYAGYSSPCLDTSFHDAEMDVMPHLDCQPGEPGAAMQSRFDTEAAGLTVRRYRLAPRPVAPADPWRPAAEGMALAMIAIGAALIWIALP